MQGKVRQTTAFIYTTEERNGKERFPRSEIFECPCKDLCFGRFMTVLCHGKKRGVAH
jgi:hypothetical protein